MNDNPNIGIGKSTAEIETHFIIGPGGRFGHSITGTPFISYGGPIAEGLGQVSPELPWQYQQNDHLHLCVMTISRDIPIPAGWTFLGQERLDAESPYMSIFYKRATSIETLTVSLVDPDEKIMAQVVASRPKPTEGK